MPIYSKLKHFSAFSLKRLIGRVCNSFSECLPKGGLKSGMTLTEIVVVIAIAMSITTALVIQQYSWRDKLKVTTAAYDLALKIREAQSFSLGVREDRSGTGDKFNASYGVHLSRSAAHLYYFFSDRDKDSWKDPGEAYAPTMVLSTDNSLLIRSICGYISGVKVCNSPDVSPTDDRVRQVIITFVRPYPGAIIKFYNSSNALTPGAGGPVSIVLRTSGNRRMEITVEENGQVSVKPV